MVTKRHGTHWILCWMILFILTGCFYRDPVKHLSSDVCLIVPSLSGKKQVLSYLGAPDQRQTSAEGEEVWLYYEVKKSALRKTPYLGEKMGHENYDLVTVTFAGEVVKTCVYRSLNEDEFKKTGIEVSEQPGKE